MKPQKLLSFVLLAAVLISTSTPAEENDTYELKPDLVVTPSRMTEPLGEALASVSVITREDIDLSVVQDLLELLRLQPGVDIVRSGGPGKQTSVFLRGSNSNHVLVLIDGVRVSSANTGAYSWEQLPVSQIERIEIVRGPSGSIYGSDSIGGVIQVFTRSSPYPFARLTSGSYGTAEFEGGLGYQGDRSQFTANIGYRDIDGFSAQNADGFSYHPDDDGFESINLGLKGSTDTDYGSWRFSLLALDNENEFDQGVSDARQLVTSLEFRAGFSPSWQYQVLGGYVGDELQTKFEFFTTDFQSKRYNFSWQNQFTTKQGGKLSFGLDYYREKGKSLFTWDESRNNTGLFVSFDRHYSSFHLQVGGRVDDNSRFGSQLTGQIAAGYEFGDAWQLTGSYGSAFRGPDLSEQFSPGFNGFFAGNPDLGPESSTSSELGLRWMHDTAGTFSAAVYRTDVENLIAFAGTNFQAINVAEARLEGLELDYSVAWNGWLLNANATIQQTQDRSSGESLLRRPNEKGSITLDHRFANGSWLGLEWFVSGGRNDFGGIKLDGYSLFNLRAGWLFTPAWRLEFRGDNLLDENYEPAFGFNSAGRSYHVSLAWMPM